MYPSLASLDKLWNCGGTRRCQTPVQKHELKGRLEIINTSTCKDSGDSTDDDHNHNDNNNNNDDRSLPHPHSRQVRACVRPHRSQYTAVQLMPLRCKDVTVRVKLQGCKASCRLASPPRKSTEGGAAGQLMVLRTLKHA